MKKVIFCAIALMFTAVGFSQVTDSQGNTSTDPTTVPILGGAATTANSGLSIQNGNSHKVKVRQAGTNQSVYTNQDDGSTGIGGNQAYVRQTGSVSSASGVENRADVLQSGAANSSITRQEGDTNDAVTRQGQNDDASSGNKSLIRQGTGQQAEDNFAGIDQDGTDNQAQTEQTYDNSDAWTQQTGTENKSMINQNAGPNQTEGHYAMNEQEGERNESSIAQRGAGARNTARALQIGSDNQAKQDQTATSGTFGTGNDAGISQGDISVARGQGVAQEATTQWSAIGALVSSPGTVGWNPPSEFNRAKQTQVGVSNSAGIIQMGGSISFDNSNYGEQDQVGAGNAAGMVQTHYYTGEAANYAKQKQEGSNNTAGLAQSGSDHQSYQYQGDDMGGSGSDNTSLAYQEGSNHKLNTYQFGDQSTAYANQHGVDNRALIVQYDGQSYTVDQNAGLPFGDRSAGGNQADILQMGPNGDLPWGETNVCEFEEPMDLNMDYTVPGLDLGEICPDC